MRPDFRDLVEDARAALQSAGLAEQTAVPMTVPAELGRRVRRTDRGTVHRMLCDSQIALFEAVGQILMRPEFR